jgi:hypothetical protein
MKFLGMIRVDFHVKDQLLIRFSAFVRYWRKMGVLWDSTSAIHRFKIAYDSVRREVLYNILIGFGIPMKLVRLTKMRLNETKSKVCKYMSEIFLI